MAITEQVTLNVATVGITDEYRVEVRQMRKVTEYSIDQALQLAEEIQSTAKQLALTQAADLRAHTREVLLREQAEMGSIFGRDF